MLVAPYIFLYTSGTVLPTVVVGGVVVVVVVELFEQAAATKLNIKKKVILFIMGMVFKLDIKIIKKFKRIPHINQAIQKLNIYK
jgi:hypothetical protein